MGERSNCCRMDELPSQAKELYSQLDLVNSLETLRETQRYIERVHKEVQRQELSLALGTVSAMNQTAAQREVQQVKRCLTALGTDLVRKTAARNTIDQWHSKHVAESLDATTSAREMLVDTMLKVGMRSEEATKNLKLWDQACSDLKTTGVAGLLNEAARKCNELSSLLDSSQNWGRNVVVLLETWQWIVIAIIICIAIAVVVACLFWAGCSWIYYIFVGACYATGAFGGWWSLCAGFGF